MRQGIYELSVIDENGVAFDECELEGKKYVRAVPGKEYKVRFTIHPDAEGNFPYTCVVCNLIVDGRVLSSCYQNPNSKHLSKPCVTLFRGMPISSDTSQAFLFSDVEVGNADNTVKAENTTKVGHISVTVYEAQRAEKRVNDTEKYFAINASTTIKEGKKFWQQPSLATASGSLMPRLTKRSEYVYNKLRQTPDATVSVQYHAADVLDVLQDLHNKKNAPPAPVPPPVHVDFSAEPETVPAVPLPTVVVDLRQDETAGVAVKVEKMQKKRKLGRSSMDQRTVEVVDLTL